MLCCNRKEEKKRYGKYKTMSTEKLLYKRRKYTHKKETQQIKSILYATSSIATTLLAFSSPAPFITIPAVTISSIESSILFNKMKRNHERIQIINKELASREL